MKLTFLLLTVACLQLRAESYAQVTMHKHNISLGKVFEQIYDQTGYQFVCTKDMLKEAKKVTINVDNASLKEVLDISFKDQPLTYTIRDKAIIVKKKENGAINQVQAIPPLEVKGSVTDSLGNPLIGVTIKAKDGGTGTVTDAGGNYTITVPDDAVLVISYVGYQTREIPVNHRQHIDIVLEPATSELNQLVVVGYGVQKKKDLTGSVTTIDFEKQVQSRPLMNVSSALSGLVPGMQAFQSSGQPGEDGAAFHIRGFGTLNNSNPLVLVDGFEYPMDEVNPNDIKTVTVLKDAASAAIYGSRAANGVILITTKKGVKGRPRFSYNGFITFQQPVNTLPFISDYDKHMQYVNLSRQNMNMPDQFSESSIEAATAARLHPNETNQYGVPNYMAFPNTNWFDVLFHTGISQHHNLSVSGGSDKVRYRLSLGYLDNQGIMSTSGLQRIEYRANIEARPLRWLTVGSNVFGIGQKQGIGNVARAFEFLPQTTPGVYPGTNDKLGIPYLSAEESSNANNLIGFLNDKEGNNRRMSLNTSLYAKIAFNDHLVFESRYNFSPDFGEYSYHAAYRRKWDYTKDQPVSANLLSDAYMYYSKTQQTRFITDQILRYHNTFATDHDVNVMVGFNETYFNQKDLHAAKKGMVDWSLVTLNSGESMDNMGGSESDWAMRSLFGRVNYAYKDKYLFEGNLRYDGSSRFSPYYRWGLFPSVSAGWQISEEPFMESLHRDIQNLKIRASWGRLGNAASGDYDWQATYGTNKTVLDGAPQLGLAVKKLGNPLLHWESTAITDIGIDIVTLRSRMSISADVYNKQTSGILYSPELYLTTGTVSPSTENIAAVNNKGVEIDIGWKDHAGKFSYQVNGNFSFNRNRVNKFKGSPKMGWTTDRLGNKVYETNLGEVSQGGFGGLIVEGHELGEHYLLGVYHGDGSYTSGAPDPGAGPKDGMIRTENDMRWLQAMMATGATFQPLNAIGKNKIWYGDLIYADKNGDGNYGDTHDQYFTGHSSLPKYNFGLNMFVSYGNFDFSAILFGSAGFYLIWKQQSYNSPEVKNGWGISKYYAEHAYQWDPDDPDNPLNNQTGSLPRLLYGTEGNEEKTSTFWEYNASFLKVRSVQLGYTIPKRLTKRILIQELRIYASGENLFTFTGYPGLDPEVGSGVKYPTLKQYAVGLNVSF